MSRPLAVEETVDRMCEEMAAAGLDPEALSLISRREEAMLRVSHDETRAKLAAAERARHHEHEARIQMEHELSEAGYGCVADALKVLAQSESRLARLRPLVRAAIIHADSYDDERGDDTETSIELKERARDGVDPQDREWALADTTESGGER